MKYLIELYARDIVNKKDIEEFIRNTVDENEIELPEILHWLDKKLRDYLQNRYEQVKKLKDYKESDPDWLKKSVENGTALEVMLSRKLQEETNLIVEYFATLDKKELSKIYKLPFENALIKADKWNKEKDFSESEGEDTIVVRTYKSGYSWVKLLTQKALTYEGDLMHHCTKNEEAGYLQDIKNNKISIFSLRSKENKPHCTIEVNLSEKIIEQVKGYSNGPIVPKYIPYVKNFIEKPLDEKSYKQVNDLKLIGIVSIDGSWHSIYRLPENTIINGNLDFTKNKYSIKLPKNLTVNGSLQLSESKIKELPENLRVVYDLNISSTDIKSLPKNLNVGSLFLGFTSILEIPDDTIVRDKLSLRHSEVRNLPHNFSADSISLNQSKVTEIPENIKVKRLDLSESEVESLPENLTVNNLILINSKIKVLPKGLRIEGVLSLNNSIVEKLSDNTTILGSLISSGSKLSELPENLIVVQHLILTNSNISELPASTKVGWSLDLSYSKILKLPDNLKLKESLLLNNTNLDYLPENLTVKGSLDISDTLITKLPKTLKAGRIYISENMYNVLEENGIPTHLKSKVKVR